ESLREHGLADEAAAHHDVAEGHPDRARARVDDPAAAEHDEPVAVPAGEAELPRLPADGKEVQHLRERRLVEPPPETAVLRALVCGLLAGVHALQPTSFRPAPAGRSSTPGRMRSRFYGKPRPPRSSPPPPRSS